MTVATKQYGTSASLTITNLNSLANSQTVGWQSAVVDNRTDKYMGFDFAITLDMANTAAANDKAVYVYMVPWLHDGSAWVPGRHLGTTTLPSGSEGACTIATSGHNLIPVHVIPYTATDQVVSGSFSITNPPQGFSLVVINYTGAAIAATGNSIKYNPYKYESA